MRLLKKHKSGREKIIAGEEERGLKCAPLNSRKLAAHQVEYVNDDFNKCNTRAALAKANMRGLLIVNFFRLFLCLS